MPIRSYQPGDELAQVRIYNQAAGSLPGFKPGTPEEVTRRYVADPDARLKYYAVEEGGIVGYAVFGSNGRMLNFQSWLIGGRGGAPSRARRERWWRG